MKQNSKKKRRAPNPAAKKTVLGVLLIAVSIAGLFYWNTVGEKKFNYGDVLVFNQDVEAGTVVTADLLCYESIPKSMIQSDRVSDPSTILGKTVTGYITNGSQLSMEMFEDPELFVGEGQQIYAIPESYIHNIPTTVRRGDVMQIYPVITGIQYDELGNILPTAVPVDVSKPLLETTILYIKDSSASEVIDDSEVESEDRMNAASIGSVIYIIATEEEYNTIKSLAEGYDYTDPTLIDHLSDPDTTCTFDILYK